MPTALRPSAVAGARLPALAARVGAVAADDTGVAGAVPNVPITGVTLRGQDVQPGDLFAALPGATTHGARYAGDAIERGAAAVLTDAAGLAEMRALGRHPPCRPCCTPHRAASWEAWPPRSMGIRPIG